jgi:hypothetical protein
LHAELRRQRAGPLLSVLSTLCFLCIPAAQRLLPDGLEVPSAFESVGHIAHLNLRGDLLPYKHLIGQARGGASFAAALPCRLRRSASANRWTSVVRIRPTHEVGFFALGSGLPCR